MELLAPRILILALSSLLLCLSLPITIHAAETHAHAADEHTQSALKRAAKHEPQLVRREGETSVATEVVAPNVDPKTDQADSENTDDHGPKIKTGKVLTKDMHKEYPPAEKAHSAPAASHAAHGDGVPPDTSLRWLQNGNTRFVKKNLRNDGRSAADRARLATGQKPHAIVLSCSDSRVPPEIVFDQALGEIFVIRVAGEALDSSVVASIEYAVEHLGSNLIVVMGHTQCGAVKAALSTKDGDSAGSADLDRLVGDIRPRLRTVLKDTPSHALEVESAVNADGVARELVKRSDIIRHKVESGTLKIKTALYRLDSGKVSFY
ncbi:MAG: carbonic anhydrase [Bdellovibrionaceae bacterium]|nr:carbonic anhydrase [Pseudobdellovibrionaceae bacterium]